MGCIDWHGQWWIMHGDAKFDDGSDSIILTMPENNQCGLATCMNDFDVDGDLKLKFNLYVGGGSGVDGFCIALLDAKNKNHLTPGTDGGALGFIDRPGALLGIGIDKYGNFGGRAGNSLVCIRGGEWNEYNILEESVHQVPIEDGEHEVKVKFSLADGCRNITLKLDGETIIDDFSIEGLELPEWLKVSIGAATGGYTNMHAIRWPMNIKGDDWQWD